jgi:hypothetical protein
MPVASLIRSMKYSTSSGISSRRSASPGTFTGTGGHFPDHGLAHRAMRLQRGGTDTQQVLLGLIAVTDHAIAKPGRAASHIRQACRNHAASAGLCRSNPLTSLHQPLTQPGGQDGQLFIHVFS